MPAKRKMNRRQFLKALAAGAAGAALVSAPGCAPVHFSGREVLDLTFSSKEDRRKKIHKKFVRTQIEAITGRSGKGKKGRPTRARKAKPSKKPAKRHGRSPFVKLGLDRSEGGMWTQICRLYNWDVARDIGKINLINHIGRKANANPAQVMLAIKRRSTKWYHARALHATVSGMGKRIASLEKQLASLPRENSAGRAKLRTSLNRSRVRKARAEVDARVLDALIAERKVSEAQKRKVKDTVISVKGRFFTRKKLERLAGEQE